MKKQWMFASLLVALTLICVFSPAAIATTKGGSDQFTHIWAYDKGLWPLTVNNESSEVFTSYSSTKNQIYVHYNDGIILDRKSYPYEVDIMNTTKLYNGSSLAGSMGSWNTYPVIYDSNDIWYPGKRTSPVFLLSKSNTTKAKITYGYFVYDGYTQIGFDDETYSFNLW